MTHQFMRLQTSRWRRPSPHRYVERGGEPVTRHPFDLYGVRLYVFPIEADLERLTLMCDRTFAAPTGGAERYVPLAGVVLVSFADITVIRSTDLPDSALGTCTEREACIWLPILDRRRDRVVWTMPYLFVDEPAPLVAGRETFGYPKQLGRVAFKQDSQGPISFEVRARCLHRFASESKVAEHRVMRIRRSDRRAPVSHTTGTWERPAQMVDEIARRQPLREPTSRDRLRMSADMLGQDSFLLEEWLARSAALLLNDVGTGIVRVVLLKQFRDPADPGKACYQAVIEVEHEVLSFRNGGLLGGEWQVEVADLDGEPLIRDLGLAPVTAAGPSFWLDFDFRLRSGQPLWEAGT